MLLTALVVYTNTCEEGTAKKKVGNIAEDLPLLYLFFLSSTALWMCSCLVGIQTVVLICKKLWSKRIWVSCVKSIFFNTFSRSFFMYFWNYSNYFRKFCSLEVCFQFIFLEFFRVKSNYIHILAGSMSWFLVTVFHNILLSGLCF